MKSASSKKKKLYTAIQNHRLSQLIHGTPSSTTIGYGRRTRERNTQKIRHRHRRHQEQLFSGSGFNRYGKLDADADGWDEERIERLLQRDIPEHELSLPNEPPPRLTAGYLSRRLSCLPTGLFRNLLKQNIDRRPHRVESYFEHQYGEVPPRVRRLLTGSYYGSFFQAYPSAHKLKNENEPLDNREYRRRCHRNRQPRPLRPPPPPPPLRPRPPAPAPQPPPQNGPSSNISSLFNFSPFSPISAPSNNTTIELDTLLDTLLEQGEIPHVPPLSPPPPHIPPFQIVPLNSNDPPPATAVEAVQQQKISSAEKSAEDLETILSVAGSSIRSVIDKLQAPVTTPTIMQQHPDDRWNDLKRMFKELEDDMNTTPNNYRNSSNNSSSSSISTENLYDDLLDHNTSPLLPPAPTHSTGYVPHKQMPSSLSSSLSSSSASSSPRITGYVAHKKMRPPSPQQQSIGTSPIPQPRLRNHATQMSPPQHRKQK